MSPLQQLHAFFEQNAPDLMAHPNGEPALCVASLVRVITEHGTRPDAVKYRRRLRGESPVTFEQVQEYAARWNAAGRTPVMVSSVVEAL